jgi:tripartite-type tricarboxylate transporter receptor subunit TctC
MTAIAHFRPLLLALLALPAIASAAAQSWPDRPIKFISSQAAGGGTDVLGRLVADQLSARLGQPIVYENRPGGGNVIGTQAAARSTPDGYTFFFATGAALVTDPYTFKSLPYDPMKDFTVLSDIAEVSFMVLGNPDVPAKNLAELFAHAKANPDKLAIATDGARRFSGMIAAWLNKLAGTQISYVPYTQMTQGVRMCSPAACSSSSSPRRPRAATSRAASSARSR